MDQEQVPEATPVEATVIPIHSEPTAFGPGLYEGSVVVSPEGHQERIVIDENGWHKERIDG